ncbi:MAG: hypothetical protein AMXMBFR53_02380 [Gemmatimonadota bacterium]
MPAKKTPLSARTLDATPDVVDFRDRMFVPTLVDVPLARSLDDYRAAGVPVLDQGTEGACTGFGLAAVVNYLMRTRRVVPSDDRASPRMLYEMAKRYDEWPGERYSGSSARGAMKAWHKHGVCDEAHWAYDPRKQDPRTFPRRWVDASRRPLGAYFRVNHKDLVAMHAAMAEVGILYATCSVHEGWGNVGTDGRIEYSPSNRGGHAFAIVGYGDDGFWIQNSWGERWGRKGFGYISYDDWLQNGTDVWVARLGVPIRVARAASSSTAMGLAANKEQGSYFHDTRPHVVSLGNDGRFRASGMYGTGEDDVREIFEVDFPRLTEGWTTKRLVLYAHGGLVPEASAVQRVNDLRDACLANRIYPISFIWKSDFWTTVKNILGDATRRRRPEGVLDAAKDFLLDRVDDGLEPIARAVGGRMLWEEMKENALMASSSEEGGARVTVVEHVRRLMEADRKLEVHLVGHSAGSIFHAGVLTLLRDLGIKVTSCTLWAPACTMDLFKQAYLPAIQAGDVERFALYTLTDRAERDDHCAHVYHRSLLYLVSNAFEEDPRIPLVRDGVPILGMQKFVEKDTALMRLVKSGKVDWVRSPNEEPESKPGAATSSSHGGFDDDEPTLRSTLARITGRKTAPRVDAPSPSAAGLAARRRRMR